MHQHMAFQGAEQGINMARKQTYDAPVNSPPITYPTCTTCFMSAHMSIVVDGIRKNMCEKCYLAHFQKQADAYSASMGLVTLEQKRKFVKERFTRIGRMREPGEDDFGGEAA